MMLLKQDFAVTHLKYSPDTTFILFSLGQSPWSMGMCLVWQSVLLGNGKNWYLFLLGDVQLIRGGGGGRQFFKLNFLAVKHL